MCWNFRFVRYFSTDDHTARLRRALIGLLWMPLLGTPQEGAEEGRPGVPPGDPLGSRRGVAASGFLCRQESGKICCYLVGEAISLPLARRFAFWREDTRPFPTKFVKIWVRNTRQKLLLFRVACVFRARIFLSKCERKI